MHSLHFIISQNRHLLSPEAFVYYKYFIKSSPVTALQHASSSEIMKCVTEGNTISLHLLNDQISSDTYEIIKQTLIFLKQRDISKERKKLIEQEREVAQLKQLVEIERALTKNAEELKRRHDALQLRLLGYVSNRVHVSPRLKDFEKYKSELEKPKLKKPHSNECQHCHV